VKPHVDFAGGHGLIGATKAQAAELGADEYGFLLWNVGVAASSLRFEPALLLRAGLLAQHVFRVAELAERK
jgi:hypothetical protein